MALTVDGQRAYGRAAIAHGRRASSTPARHHRQRQLVSGEVVLTTSGHPAQMEPALSQGYEVRAQLFHARRQAKVDPASVRQNDRFVVVLKVTETGSRVRPAAARRPPAGRASRSTIRTCSTAARSEALSLAESDVEPDAHRVSRRPVRRRLRPQTDASGRSSTSPMSCARSRRAATCSRRRPSRTCTGRSVSGAPASA